MESMQWLFWAGLIAVFAWMAWMSVYRPEQWERLVETDRKRKKETVNGLLKLGGLGWRTYRRFK